MLHFVAEEHTNKSGRKYVQSKLNNGELKILFIEFPNEVRMGSSLKNVCAQSVGQSELIIRNNLAGYFNNLKKEDAEPNIKELTIQALSKGVTVYPIDMLVEEVDKAYTNLTHYKHPFSKNTWTHMENVKPYESEKLALRNVHMASKIVEFMPSPATGVQALFLCGANHFKPSATRGEIESSSYGWPDVNPYGVDQIVGEMRPDITHITHFSPKLSVSEQRKLETENANLVNPQVPSMVLRSREDIGKLQQIRKMLQTSTIGSNSKSHESTTTITSLSIMK